MRNVSVLCDGQTWTEWKRQEHARKQLPFNGEEVDLNWTYWNLKVESIDLKVSLWQFLDGTGLVKSAKFKGVRGIVDREHVTWTEEWVPVRRIPQTGDFDISGFEVEDLLVTVKNPRFRQYTVSIFHAELPRLRRQRLLYDCLTANSAVGMFDDCLFSLHKPQVMESFIDEEELKWSKIVILIKINFLEAF